MEDIEKLQKHIDKIMNEQNNQGLPDFDGYSPIEMQYILCNTFEKNSPIQLLKLTESDYKRIPILNQIKYLLKLIENHGELRLTNKGFLPTKIVSDIYNQGFIKKEEHIDSGISKLYKETDSSTINLTRILIEISGIAKKWNNKLSLTKKGKSIIGNDFKLLFLIFTIFGTKFNWAYYDGYGQNSIGQLGFGFSLILLSKYGTEKRIDKFYSDKYFKAFPQLINEIAESNFKTNQEQARRCYSLRTFDRFLDYFGLIKIESENGWNAEKYIIKTELFDRLIQSTPHNNVYKK
ncbi:hypothetical protein H8E88_07615 [candidate division KSB1 bacterium]|nr:hypothetical protein [candidate division KSB1 bacterium]MBL7092438.1 hypothetical protein [candidate division KSB1 bacterium]